MSNARSEEKRSKSHITEFPELVTVREAAKVLRLSGFSIRRYLSQGVLRGIKIGGTWRIRRDDLLALLQTTRQAA